MLFVSAMRPEYIFHYKRLQENKDELLLKLLKERQYGRPEEPTEYATRNQSIELDITSKKEKEIELK